MPYVTERQRIDLVNTQLLIGIRICSIQQSQIRRGNARLQWPLCCQATFVRLRPNRTRLEAVICLKREQAAVLQIASSNNVNLRPDKDTMDGSQNVRWLKKARDTDTLLTQMAGRTMALRPFHVRSTVIRSYTVTHKDVKLTWLEIYNYVLC